MKIFVIHAVCTIFPLSTNIESIVAFFYTDTRKQRHTLDCKNPIVVMCSDVEVLTPELVLSVIVLFAVNMSVVIMSLEFGRRPTKKF